MVRAGSEPALTFEGGYGRWILINLSKSIDPGEQMHLSMLTPVVQNMAHQKQQVGDTTDFEPV